MGTQQVFDGGQSQRQPQTDGEIQDAPHAQPGQRGEIHPKPGGLPRNHLRSRWWTGGEQAVEQIDERQSGASAGQHHQRKESPARPQGRFRQVEQQVQAAPAPAYQHQTGDEERTVRKRFIHALNYTCSQPPE